MQLFLFLILLFFVLLCQSSPHQPCQTRTSAPCNWTLYLVVCEAGWRSYNSAGEVDGGGRMKQIQAQTVLVWTGSGTPLCDAAAVLFLDRSIPETGER